MEHWPTLQFLMLFFVLSLLAGGACALYRMQARRREQNIRLFHAEQIDSPDDIQRLLETMLKEKVRLRIRLNDRRRSYASTLLSIEPPWLLIDELFPVEGNELIRDSRFIVIDFLFISIELQRLHLSYSFSSTYAAAEQWKGFPSLRIAFPDRIIRNQKRKYLRISPPVNEPLFIQFGVDGQSMIEKIVNISASGASFYTNLGASVLYPGNKTGAVRIDLPDCRTIACRAVVRTLRKNDQPVLIDGKPILNYCGIEFINLDNRSRDIIVKYVIARERQELKYISREFA